MSDTLTRLHNAATYQRLSIRLTKKAARILHALAEGEQCTVQQQASYMLENHLRALEARPDEQVAVVVRQLASTLQRGYIACFENADRDVEYA